MLSDQALAGMHTWGELHNMASPSTKLPNLCKTAKSLHHVTAGIGASGSYRVFFWSGTVYTRYGPSGSLGLLVAQPHQTAPPSPAVTCVDVLCTAAFSGGRGVWRNIRGLSRWPGFNHCNLASLACPSCAVMLSINI
jgi:hypothetical protein